MKFLLAMLVWLIMGTFIGAGIVVAVTKGSVWLLIGSVLAFIILVGKFGCMPPKEHH
jgi:hypothetical protein